MLFDAVKSQMDNNVEQELNDELKDFFEKIDENDFILPDDENSFFIFPKDEKIEEEIIDEELELYNGIDGRSYKETMNDTKEEDFPSFYTCLLYTSPSPRD